MPTRLKLAALWTSTALLHVHAGLYDRNGGGVLGATPVGATQGVFAGTFLTIPVPSLMVALSMLLTTNLCRWLNVALVWVCIGIVVLAFPGADDALHVVEMGLAMAIAVVAMRWPRGLPGS